MFYDNYMNLCSSVNKAPTAVAEEMGFTRSAASFWQSGAIPRKSTLYKIADYFGVTISDLLADDVPTVKAKTDKKTSPPPKGNEPEYYLEMFIEEASFEQLQAAYRKIRGKLLGEE